MFDSKGFRHHSHRRLILILLATALLCTAPAVASINVEAKGRLLCNGQPMAGVQVDLMHSIIPWDDIFDRVMASAVTDDDGRYYLRGAGAGSRDNPPAPYVRAVYISQIFTPAGLHPVVGRITNELNSIRSDHGDMRAHPWEPGVIDMGDNDFTTLDCELWRNTINALRDYKGAIEGDAPLAYSDLRVEKWSAIYGGTAWAAVETIFWPTDYTPTFTRALHEVGHTVRHSFDGDWNHFFFDATRFVYARSHSERDVTNEGYAFNEGWAELWETRDTVPPRARAFYNTPPRWDVEGDVAAELRRLAGCESFANMARVLRENPGAIHSRDEFLAAYRRMYPGACDPPPDPPPSNGCASGKTTQQFFNGMAGCAGHVSHKDAGTLCASGFAVCTADQYIRGLRHLKPEHNYWVSDQLDNSTYLGRCAARPAGKGTACGNASMHPCLSSGTDPEGNTCNDRDCFFDPPPGTEFPAVWFFGGCGAGDDTAGALCCPVASATATTNPREDEAARQRHRDVLLRSIQDLEARLAAARQSAVLPSTCPEKTGCGPAVWALVQPALLTGAIERNRAFLAHLDADPDPRARLAQGDFERWQQEYARRYVLELLAIERRAVQNALAALKPALGSAVTADDAKAVAGELTGLVGELDEMAKHPEKPSPNLQTFDPEKWLSLHPAQGRPR